jgi:hypothetical protein
VLAVRDLFERHRPDPDIPIPKEWPVNSNGSEVHVKRRKLHAAHKRMSMKRGH